MFDPLPGTSPPQAQPIPRALSIPEFCALYAIGRTKAYEELRSGRLRARKAGHRTLIAADDAEAWLSKLPLASARR